MILRHNPPVKIWRYESAKSQILCSLHNLYNCIVPDGTPPQTLFYELCCLYMFIFVPLNLTRLLSSQVLNKEDIQKDSSEQPSSTKAGIVTFLDNTPGYMDSVPSVRDELRDAAFKSDADISDFFSRPLRVGSVDWFVGGGLASEYNIWQLYFENEVVREKIARYRLLSCDMHVKVTVNGSPFHYGRAIASYTPLALYDDLTRVRTSVSNDTTALSQRPHCYIDPACSQGGEIHCPFVWVKNALDIPGKEWAGMGTLSLRSMQPLKHANGATDQITVSIFVWTTNMRLGVPTQWTQLNNPDIPVFDAIQKDADEYGKGAISRPAGVLANMASKMASMPMIGPYMRATQLAASATSGIATLFGYSRTPVLETSVYRPVVKGSFALTNVQDDVAKLSVDGKQELCVDTRTFGLSGEDELDIKKIAGTESWLTSFDWPLEKSQEELLFNMVVDPMIFSINAANPGERHLPACAFASLPFQYWRGSMKYRFQVVASNYHRGRLKIVWDPVRINMSASLYNAAYTTIVDISESTDFTITVGWGQPETFRPRNDFTETDEANMFGSAYIDNTTAWAGNYAGSFKPSNGFLAVYVVNELAVPMNTIDNDITINVFVSAGDDFEVACPYGEDMASVRFTNADDVEPILPPERFVVSPLISEGTRPPIQKDSEEVAAAPQHDAPELEVVSDVLGAVTTTVDNTQNVHFGEVISNFRPLLKRYNIHELLPEYVSDVQRYVRVHRPAMPFAPGYVSEAKCVSIAENPTSVPQRLVNAPDTDKYFAYGNMTMAKYISSSFVCWRGSMRWIADTSMYANQNLLQASPTIHRSHAIQLGNLNEIMPTNIDGNSGRSLLLFYGRDEPGHDGYSLADPNVNPLLSVDIPHYTHWRFAPARWQQNFKPVQATITDLEGVRYDDPWPFMACWKLAAFVMSPWNATGIANPNLGTSTYIQTSCAVGDDFTVGFFIGAPPMFIQGVYPT